MDNDDKQLWGVDDVAAFLRIPRMNLYHWRRTGYGPPATKVGRYLRYRPQDVRGWFDTQLHKNS